jgi:hypothetical protein
VRVAAICGKVDLAGTIGAPSIPGLREVPQSSTLCQIPVPTPQPHRLMCEPTLAVHFPNPATAHAQAS